MPDFRDEMRKITYEPAKKLIESMEAHYDELTFDQKKDLEKLKFGIKMYDLEQQEQRQKGSGFRWA